MNHFQQLACPMNGLPIQLVLIAPSGQIGFSKSADRFPTIFDHNNEVIITEDCLLVFGETIRYNSAFDMTEGLKRWLVSLELEKPWH